MPYGSTYTCVQLLLLGRWRVIWVQEIGQLGKCRGLSRQRPGVRRRPSRTMGSLSVRWGRTLQCRCDKPGRLGHVEISEPVGYFLLGVAFNSQARLLPPSDRGAWLRETCALEATVHRFRNRSAIKIAQSAKRCRHSVSTG